ncbi:MAG TPA: DHA2 family efflux MFS transporter permease subunit [Chthoniobacteraceae bacterium]|nr:DHA2 family efflux MFS transporter permease subunit [Chthoniobacteraceae bacterium]
MSAHQEAAWIPRHNPWLVALTVTIATFMEVLDTSIANVALPHIAGSLSASVDESTWVLTSYLVANAVTLPLSAWLSNRMGRKRFYMTCVLLFTVSSLCCGLCTSLSMLIFFRVLQGLGGGGLAPSEQAILADTFPPRMRGAGFALYGMAVVLAPAIGPTLGGYITDHYSWHWIFFINLPVGVVSLMLTSIMVDDPPHVIDAREHSRGKPVDYIGFALVALGLGATEVVLDKGQENDWFSSPFIVLFSVLAVIGISYFIIWEWNEEHPILELRLLKNPNLAVACSLMFALGAILFGTTVLIPEYLQTVMGYTAESAGMVLSPGGFMVMICMPIVGQLVSRIDARRLIAFGFITLMISLVYMSSIYPGIDIETAMKYRIFQCVGLSFLFVPINTISFVNVPPSQGNQVSALINLFRNLGGSVGISALSTMLARGSQVHQNFLSAHTGSPAYNTAMSSAKTVFFRSGASLPDAAAQATTQLYRTLEQQATALAYIDAIRTLAVCCAIALPLVLLARRNHPGGKPAMAH